MKEPLHIAEVIEEIETEMGKMWACDEATYVMEHDEEYIVCSGGSKLLLPDGRMLESEDDMKDLYWSKPNDCSNIGDWSEGIDYFVEKLND